MKLDRLIGILSILLQQEKTTMPQLAERFEVSRRTIQRDIDSLCLAGIPIVTRQGARGGISIMEGYTIDRTLLTADELQSILTGLRSLDSVSGTGRYALLMEKLSPGASNLMAGDQHILINLAAWSKTALTPKIELIHVAICEAKRIAFTYHAPSGESERVVEPYDLIFQWSSWYVWGWCGKRQDFRLFKLNRMTALRLAGSFTRRPAPLPDLSQPAVFPHVHQVRACVQPAYKWRLIEEFGPESFSVLPDGQLLFSFGFTDTMEIVRWIASFGGGAELLEPAFLRDQVAQFAEDVRHRHLET